ncbi:zinc-dependent metalloprotease [Cumulibacter soli]|uniref:zinc-dependent metalloprotease n=1 Tax=Cumulibacter soli TaxID=2546344 RepID=UPI0010686802|nr:zinc-dependent metalloprotease [Cumulibacter soli]
MSSEGFINWDVAMRSAKKLTKAGPSIALEEARTVVTELRQAAARADEYVSDVTGIRHPMYDAPTLVVDRAGWIETNASSLAGLMGPLVEKLTATSKSSRAVRAVGSRVTGIEAGVLLSFMSSRVLGQYDVFGRDGGRLLLVAPNIVEAERKLAVDPHDFRLWVCIHEVTHRLQFTANPWLEGYLRGLIEEFVEVSNLDTDSLREQIKELAAKVRTRSADESGGLLSLVQSPDQRDVLDRITAAMSLVEGHAEYVMDNVGRDVIRTVGVIRRKFNARRKGSSPIDRAMRRLLGLDAKMKQYADGRIFVDAVVNEVGMAGFNRIWESPDMLPTRAELSDPVAWVDRVRPNGRIAAAGSTVVDQHGNTTRHFEVPREGTHVPLDDGSPDDEREIIIERRGDE